MTDRVPNLTLVKPTAAANRGWPAATELHAIVRMAAQACGTPAAALYHVDDGALLPMAHHLRGTAQHQLVLHDALRDDTLLAERCLTHEDAFMVLPALGGDASWPRSPWQSLMATRLSDAQEQTWACLLVLDTEPRAFSAEQCQALHDAATLAGTVWSRYQLSQEAERLRTTDPLTGLANRGVLMHALDVELAHAMRTGEPYTLLRLQLDGFNEVRDGFGAAAADEVVLEVARRLQQAVRLGDPLARLGEDNFGVLMRHGANDNAEVLARRIVKGVSAPITLSSGDEIGVGISVGLAAYSDNLWSSATLLQQADQALAEARKRNEKRWKMFVGIR